MSPHCLIVLLTLILRNHSQQLKVVHILMLQQILVQGPADEARHRIHTGHLDQGGTNVIREWLLEELPRRLWSNIQEKSQLHIQGHNLVILLPECGLHIPPGFLQCATRTILVQISACTCHLPSPWGATFHSGQRTKLPMHRHTLISLRREQWARDLRTKCALGCRLPLWVEEADALKILVLTATTQNRLRYKSVHLSAS